ncbi:rhodanese-like domain-containing protein [Sulfuriferula plumbiphila]|uniref:Rhodanese-like domain-containing protein n=1 Tax=Sulfuriferula plumbiphila TaxID=171865 RepID=A0A512LA41_9PROT|nr:rhodanese-like domain-containing protein [Sulfuriferula plumbiphila]BBP05716.1 rhodanese-like domain-containing protein [Sulfuriferula plumbiphila]GEP31322.1 rhodanese-like domain-containing protein [Sulfuriferula plumbiphila]
MQQIGARALQQWLQDADRASPLLLDVREPWEYEYCHIVNARLVPMHSVPGKLDTLDQHAQIVVICHHGMRSMQVARFLEHAGFDRIYNLQGGVDSWAQLVDTSMPTY